MTGSSSRGRGRAPSVAPERWPRVEAVLDRALELPPDEVPVFLDEACAGDPHLRQDVERVLAACRAASDRLAFLESAAGDFAATLLSAGAAARLPDGATAAPAEPEETLETGELVGPYRLLGHLGSGGMGVVYLAERADGRFRRQVALKVVKRGLDTAAVLDRFRNERRILAGLEHPSIAQLLDAGATEDGRPYFVLERVEGWPIDRYCDERGLDVEARLRLFTVVCGAVQHAHANLVVHRDLKPSNILITTDGQVKLLDFGIAKVLDDAGVAGETALTTAGIRALTPEYAAPEHLRGEPVTTAADVYSLGVVLYRLLTGELPFRLDRRSPEHAARLLSETDPPPPSRAFSRVPDREPAAPVVRRHARRLRGDLDAVVLTALRQDAARRYPSVEALSQDIQRYLDRLPVRARPDSLSYRASRFVRRHRIGVAAMAGVVLTLAGASVVVSLQQAQTARERDRAQLEAAKAGSVAAFLTELFEAADPEVPREEPITVDELLETGALRLETELAEHPEVAAELAAVLAAVYENLGQFGRAIPLAERSLALREEVDGPLAPETGAAVLRLARLQRRSGDLAAAGTLLDRVLEPGRRAPVDPTALASTLEELGTLRLDEGLLEEADSLFRRAVELRRAAESPPLVLAATLSRLAIVSRRRGAFEAAEAQHREALSLRLTGFGEDHRLVVESRRNLALVLHSMGRFEEAEALYRAVLLYYDRLYEGRHPNVGVTLNSLGSLLLTRGEFEEAEAMLRRAVALQRALLGPDHPQIASSLTNLGNVLARTGEFGAAVEFQEEALAMRRRIFDPAHPLIATSLNNLGLTLRDAGRAEAAIPLLEEAIALYAASFGPEHHWRAYPLVNLGDVRLWRGELGAADSLYRQAHALLRGAFPADHADVAEALLGLGEVAALSGRPAEAEPLLREALAIRAGALGGHWKVAEARSVLGDCLSRLGRVDEAEALLTSGYRDLAGALGEASIHTRRAERRLDEHARRWAGGG